jgi:uncharacterized phiE125 gp8 family phage protein
MALRLKRTTNPSEEPVNLAEAKSHLRIDISEDDTLIETLLQAAREYVEETTHRALVTQTWTLGLENWPRGDRIALPRPPLISVTSVVYVDSDGDSNVFAAANYNVDTVCEPGELVLAYGCSWPSATLRPMAPITVTYQAGYGGAASVPQHLKQAILLLTAHWYENRESTVTGAGVLSSEIPFTVESLIWLNRVF